MNFCRLLSFLCLFSMWSISFAEEGGGVHVDEGCACINLSSHRSIDTVLACYEDPRCYDYRRELKITLRYLGRNLGEAIQSYLLLANNPVLSGEERRVVEQHITRGRHRIEMLRETINFVGFEEIDEPLYIDFDFPQNNYHKHYYSFNLGYEYVSFDRIFEQGFPRIGFLVYRRYGEAPAVGEGLGFYGVHLIGNLQLANSADQESQDGTDRPTKNAIEINAEIFVPFLHSVLRLDRTLSDYVGVLLTFRAIKSELDNNVTSRFYAGVRSTFNPETHIDLLYGWTEGKESQRFEIRAKIPVYKFEHGSRILFGAILNMSLPWDRQVDEEDIYRTYLEWNADFGKILEGVTSVVGI